MSQNNKRWLPLETNPVLINEYIASLGIDTNRYEFSEVLGIDPELLAFVPQPVHALLLLFPITPDSERAKEIEEKRITDKGQKVSDTVWFSKQTVGNACGTMAVLHALMNNIRGLEFLPNSFLARFKEETQDMTPIERAAAIEQAEELEQSHQLVASQGDSELAPIEEPVNLHFVAFVYMAGYLFELDGRKEFPINHGPIVFNTLLEKTAEVAQMFMDRDPDNLRFSLMALIEKTN